MMKKRENIVTESIALRLRDVLDLLGKRAPACGPKAMVLRGEDAELTCIAERAVLGLARLEVGLSRNRDAFVALSCAWTLDGTGSPNELR